MATKQRATFTAMGTTVNNGGFTSIFLEGGWWNDARAHNNFMIPKFTAQMRPRAQGSQRVTEEHNSFIGASINARAKEFIERSQCVVAGSL